MSRNDLPDPLCGLRNLPTLYNIIIGDFGREAGTRYLSVLASEERAYIAGLLSPSKCSFLDEYRRIMFSLVGDVAFIKRRMIHEAWESDGKLSDRVLVAVHGNPVPKDLTERLAILIRNEVSSAVIRGHANIRVSLVCNALSEVLAEAVVLASSPDIGAIAERHGITLIAAPAPLQPVSAHGVIQASLSEMRRLRIGAEGPVLVLGAKMARNLYGEWGRQFGIHTLDIGESQQETIDEAVLLSIDGDPQGLLRARRAINQGVIQPLRQKYPNLDVLEACTDFEFGIGHDSVRLMAAGMVREAYAASPHLGIDSSSKVCVQ